ncbi:MAG: LamG-like jellyroll fold domain-containing protein [Verrucomicrobiota bacterium]
MKRFPCLFACGILLSGFAGPAQTLWRFNNLTNIGGHAVTVRGHPRVVVTPVGDAIAFNGLNDGLVLSNNPLGGLSSFTVELIFRQDPLTVPTAAEPRIVHIQTPGSSADAHRFTMETRVNQTAAPQTFHLDSFLRFGDRADRRLTLFNDRFPHPVAEWTHMAVTWDGTNFCNYVNGQLELCGKLHGQAFADAGATWIGQRANGVGYFEGFIFALRVSPRLLGTNEFLGGGSAYDFRRSAFPN